jgi:predicted transposase YdaD
MNRGGKEEGRKEGREGGKEEGRMDGYQPTLKANFSTRSSDRDGVTHFYSQTG